MYHFLWDMDEQVSDHKGTGWTLGPALYTRTIDEHFTENTNCFHGNCKVILYAIKALLC